MIRRPPRSTQSRSSAASDVYKRQTYINGPAHLDALFRWKKDPRVFFAGQLTGDEGYLESAATGLMVGATLAQLLEGREPRALTFSTALGSLAKHVSAPREQDYTPMNVTFGLIEDEEAPDVPQTRDRAKRREEIGRRALASVARWREEALPAAALLPR